MQVWHCIDVGVALHSIGKIGNENRKHIGIYIYQYPGKSLMRGPLYGPHRRKGRRAPWGKWSNDFGNVTDWMPMPSRNLTNTKKG